MSNVIKFPTQQTANNIIRNEESVKRIKASIDRIDQLLEEIKNCSLPSVKAGEQ
jgi:hypothetical protein